MDSLTHNVRIAIEAAASRKAEEMLALDVSQVCGFTNTMLICNGRSQRQVRTIAEAVLDALREAGLKPHHQEGLPNGDWILIDYLDFVVHVFQEERRRFYALEHLWGDAPRLDLGEVRAETGTGS